MSRPVPTPIFHITHIDHLPRIIASGLLCDAQARGGPLAVEIGNRSIKDTRRRTPVKVAPGGVVADYAPFYYRAHGPFMCAIANGRVPHYGSDTDPLVVLVTTVERLAALGRTLVITDRNAALDYAQHSSDLADLDDLVAWEVIHAQYWTNFSQGRELRMAECLVHESVPWGGFSTVATKTEVRADQVRAIIGTHHHRPEVRVEPGWYF